MNEDDFKFRVPLDDGTQRCMYFEDGNDAKDFAQACFYATHIEIRTPKGWTTWWEDGEIISMRAGFFIMVRYRSKEWNAAVEYMKQHNSNATKEKR